MQGGTAPCLSGHAGYLLELKNTAPAEAGEDRRYAALNRIKNIGVITPFVNPEVRLIEEALARAKVDNVTCRNGACLSGDEKDVILFPRRSRSRPQAGTYEWLKNNKSDQLWQRRGQR